MKRKNESSSFFGNLIRFKYLNLRKKQVCLKLKIHLFSENMQTCKLFLAEKFKKSFYVRRKLGDSVDF